MSQDSIKRAFPLLTLFGVAPACTVDLDEFQCAALESSVNDRADVLAGRDRI